MSDWKEIVKALAEQYDITLNEATVIRAPSPWDSEQKITILKNPTKEEYEAFINNTKYHAIRGISVKGNMYIADADVGIHDMIIDSLAEMGKIPQGSNITMDCMFEENDKGLVTLRGKITPRLKEVYGDKLNDVKPDWALMDDLPRTIDDLSYFNLEDIYNNIYQMGDKQRAGKYSQKFGADFFKLLPKKGEERWDVPFDTFLNDFNRIIRGQEA